VRQSWLPPQYVSRKVYVRVGILALDLEVEEVTFTGIRDMRLFATGATGYNFAMFILTSEFFVVVVLHDRSIVAERTSGEPFN
jgi:hypothetical protein